MSSVPRFHFIKKPHAFFAFGFFISIFLVLGALILFSAVHSDPVFAQVASPTDQNFGLETGFAEVGVESDQGVQSLAASIINIVLGLLGIIAVGLIIYAGFLWTTAAGNEQQVEKAKLILRNATIGLVIVFSSWAIASFVLSRLGQATDVVNGPGGGGGGGVPGTLPADRFRIRSFDTSYGGSHSGDNVTLCSSVQSQFNHWLGVNDVDAALAAQSLKIVRLESERNSSNGSTILNPPEDIAIEVVSRSNVLRFDRIEDEDWQEYSTFEVQVPKSIGDHAGKPLSDCTAQGCNDRGSYYAWTFTTTDLNDEQKPSLVQSYPQFPVGEQGPDRNVDRSAVLSFDFSEAIDIFSITEVVAFSETEESVVLKEESIVLEQINPDNNQLISTIPRDHFDISVHGKSIQIALNEKHQSSLNDGPYFDPFTWYRIRVNGVQDLCGNVMEQPALWLFQTNGNIPGVAFVYPSDGYEHACLDTETFVRFKTSMYDIVNTSCAVSPDGGGLVLEGDGFTNRSLHVSDPAPETEAGPINPNTYCKQYDFGTTEDSLTVEATYKPDVTYRNPVNDTQEQRERWEFTVASADQCVKQPYLSELKPNAGGWGRCLTAVGGYLRSSEQQAIGLHTTLNTDISLGAPNEVVVKEAWEGQSKRLNERAFTDRGTIKTAVVADFIQSPDLPLPEERTSVPFEVWAVASVENVGEIESNRLSFTAYTDEIYNGPCVTELFPNDGSWGSNVTISGVRLGLNGDEKSVLFSPAVQATEIQEWQTNDQSEEEDAPLADPNAPVKIIGVKVPALTLDGDVRVVVNGVASNGLPFDVTGGIGASCSVSANVCSPNVSLCKAGLVCGAGCTCQSPQDFKITTVSPKNACQDSCTNAVMSFETNKNIDSLVNMIDVQRCADATCAWNAQGNQSVSVTASFAPNTRQRVLLVPSGNNNRLASNKIYRVRVSGLTAAGESLGGHNFDSDGDDILDSYSWVFHTGGEACGVDRVELSPNKGRLVDSFSYTYGATPYSRINSCAASGQELTLAGQFEWGDGVRTLGSAPIPADEASGTPAIEATVPGVPVDECVFGSGSNVGAPYVEVAPGFTHATSTASVVFPNNVREQSSAWVCARHTSNRTVVGAAPVTLEPKCKTNADCTTNACTSTCEQATGLCRPNITSVSPTSGAVGTWATIQGCYFGADWGEVRVGGVLANKPDAALCGNTWTDSQIIAEVNTTGAVEVIRGRDGRTAGASQARFSINATEHPAICRVSPGAQSLNGVVDIKGKRFGLLSGEAGLVFASTTNESLSRKSRLVVSKESYCPDTGWTDDHACIRVVTDAPLGDGAVRIVTAANQESGGYSFRVLDRATRVGSSQDLLVTSHFPNAPACTNALIEITFDTLLDVASIGVPINVDLSAGEMSASHIYVQTGNTFIGGRLTVRSTSRTSTVRLYPADRALSPNTKYVVVLKGGVNGLRSETNGIISSLSGDACDALVGDNCILQFSTVTDVSAEQCDIKKLVLDPVNPIFTCAGNGCDGDVDVPTNGHQRSFLVTPINGYDQPVTISTPLTWTSSDPTIVSPISTSIGETQITTIQQKNGTSRIRVASSELGLSSATDARVFLCQNPWPASMGTDGIPFNDTSGSTDFTSEAVKTNFSTYYCRDRGESGFDDDLPALGPDNFSSGGGIGIEFGVNDTGRSLDTLLKEIFLTQPRSRTCTAGDKALLGTTCAASNECGAGGVCVGEVDAIGVRVLQNKENHTIQNWYASQAFTQGNPQPITLDTFDALQEGSTVYVNSPNDTQPGGTGANTVFNNVYLISINNSAHPDTLNIYNQLVQNWQFLENIENAEEEDKLRRDLVRLQHMKRMSRLLNSTSFPPTLTSGSFKAGLSLSVWPSWRNALSSDFGTSLPVDPLNTISCSAPNVDETCYFQTTTDPNGYLCRPDSSSFYVYKNSDGVASFMTKLEYTSEPSRWNGLLQNGWSKATDRCVNLSYTR